MNLFIVSQMEEHPLCPDCGERHPDLPNEVNEMVDRLNKLIEGEKLDTILIALGIATIQLAHEFIEKEGEERFQQLNELINQVAAAR